MLLLGVTYKPDLADQEGSPAREIAARLMELGAPSATTTRTSRTGASSDRPVPRADSLYEAAADADLTVLLQHHRTYDLQGLAVKAQLLLDTRGASPAGAAHRRAVGSGRLAGRSKRSPSCSGQRQATGAARPDARCMRPFPRRGAASPPTAVAPRLPPRDPAARAPQPQRRRQRDQPHPAATNATAPDGTERTSAVKVIGAPHGARRRWCRAGR